ncbi:variable surface lipoprotein [Metamycoplasma alkalescens]|uniref:variable surface lipoprotein n=1 Tax=Metamycoplasma alkalescens TaxID=45363 RepID=UPI003CFC9F9A
MKKINKIFITLASIVSISSLPIVAAACDEKKREEGAGANSGTKDQKEQTPQKDQSNQTPQKDQSNQTPPKNQKEQNTKKYRLPGLKDFLDKNNNKLFELVDKTSADEELNKLANEGALRIDNGKIKHHKDKGRGKNKKSRSRSSYKDVEHLKLNSKFGESNKVNTHGKNNENIGYNLGGNKKGIKISKEDNKIVLEWQLYFEDGTKDNKIYKQEIDLN